MSAPPDASFADVSQGFTPCFSVASTLAAVRAYLFVVAESHLTHKGNQPPWALPNKAKYSPYDSKRAKAYFGCPKMEVPDFFPILSLLVSRLHSNVRRLLMLPSLNAAWPT